MARKARVAQLSAGRKTNQRLSSSRERHPSLPSGTLARWSGSVSPRDPMRCRQIGLLLSGKSGFFHRGWGPQTRIKPVCRKDGGLLYRAPCPSRIPHFCHFALDLSVRFTGRSSCGDPHEIPASVTAMEDRREVSRSSSGRGCCSETGTNCSGHAERLWWLGLGRQKTQTT